jgi:hypothetical protein
VATVVVREPVAGRAAVGAGRLDPWYGRPMEGRWMLGAAALVLVGAAAAGNSLSVAADIWAMCCRLDRRRGSAGLPRPDRLSAAARSLEEAV